jgi:hypothetical protein
MYEILPIAAGVVFAWGLLQWGPRETSARVVASIVFAIVMGVVAATVSGELAESWLFVIVDTTGTLITIAISAAVMLKVGWPEPRRSA